MNEMQLMERSTRLRCVFVFALDVCCDLLGSCNRFVPWVAVFPQQLREELLIIKEWRAFHQSIEARCYYCCKSPQSDANAWTRSRQGDYNVEEKVGIVSTLQQYDTLEACYWSNGLSTDKGQACSRQAEEKKCYQSTSCGAFPFN